MKNALSDLNSISLPSKYLKEIFIFKEIYDDYFIAEMPYKFEAINEIENVQTKLQALVELDIKAQKLLAQYQEGYKKILAGFFLDQSEDDRMKGACSRTYSFFLRYEEMYRFLPDQITISILKLRAKIEINLKYNVKKSPNRKSDQKLPIDINKEFQKLFIHPIIEPKFIELLIDAEYLTEKEKWKGVSNRPGELREAYRVLKMKDLLTPGKHQLSSLKTFYKRFGLKPEVHGDKDFYISIKSLSSQTTTKDYDLFMELLSPLWLNQV